MFRLNYLKNILRIKVLLCMKELKTNLHVLYVDV